MPTYEYACSACGHQFEEFQSIKAKPLTVCPVCRKRKVKRLISAGAGFIFKGSGFYITDYRSDSYKAAAKSDGAPAPAATPPAGTSGGAAAPANGSKGATETAPAKAAPVKSETTAASKSASKTGKDSSK